MKIWIFVGICLMGQLRADYKVHVDSFNDSEKINRATPMTFEIPTDLPKDNLEVKDRTKELVESCTKVAKIKELKVGAASPGVLHVVIEWEGITDKTYNQGHITYCHTGTYSTWCSGGDRQVTVYKKEIRMSFYQGEGSARTKVHEVKAWFESRNASFFPGTADVLCRGALHDFPKKLRDEIYSVDLDS